MAELMERDAQFDPRNSRARTTENDVTTFSDVRDLQILFCYPAAVESGSRRFVQCRITSERGVP